MIRVFPLLAPYSNCGPYGPRGAGFHYGIDLCAPTGTTIVAVDDGTITYGTDPMGGNVAVLHAPDGNAYYHAHMLDAQTGSLSVSAGTTIGRVDMTGNAFGTVPHLHFEWWPSGAFQRPAPDPTAQILASLGTPASASAGAPVWLPALVTAAGGLLLLGAAWRAGYFERFAHHA
jgi:murein DD-endopeptidase MepM/ murein hydrolase activator NlpD